MSITLGNPIIITSGQLSSPITFRNLSIDKIYWHQPTGDSTSGLLIRKTGASGPEFLRMAVESSGQSQVMNFAKNTWWKAPYIECMPTGTLYIYQR